MRAGLLFVVLLSAVAAWGQNDSKSRADAKERIVDGKVFLKGLRAAERKAFGSKPLHAVDTVRGQMFSNIKQRGTKGRYDKEYARFVTEVERAGLLRSEYRMLVCVDKVSPRNTEGVFPVEGTWTPMERRWRYYMTPSEKRDYGKSTGRRGRMFVQKVYTSSDRARDDCIEQACHQRKKQTEGIEVRMELCADAATDIRLVETAEIVGVITDFSVTYHDRLGHAVDSINVDVTSVRVKKSHR
jgi:hypothetical protein